MDRRECVVWISADERSMIRVLFASMVSAVVLIALWSHSELRPCEELSANRLGETSNSDPGQGR